jgi:hypothetical protein
MQLLSTALPRKDVSLCNDVDLREVVNWMGGYLSWMEIIEAGLTLSVYKKKEREA